MLKDEISKRKLESPDLDKIMRLAKAQHAGQKYGDDDYFDRHVVDVALKTLALTDCKVLSFKVQALNIALLHDTLEDTDTTLEYLNDCDFISDEEVYAIDLLTKRKGYVLSDYLEKIKENDLAWIVKLADTMVNMESGLQQGNYKRAKSYAKQLNILLDRGRFSHKSG